MNEVIDRIRVAVANLITESQRHNIRTRICDTSLLWHIRELREVAFENDNEAYNEWIRENYEGPGHPPLRDKDWRPIQSSKPQWGDER